MIQDRCVRCGREAPPVESDEYVYWETLTGEELVCPDCVTPEEQQAADERMAELGPTEKVRENRLRRMAERQGLRLKKSRRRDPRALDYGTYALLDEIAGGSVAVTESKRLLLGLSLDDVEAHLTR